MIELIDNTLHILSIVTKSKSSLLAKVSNSECSIISTAGVGCEKFLMLVNSLKEVQDVTHFDIDEATKLPVYNEILSELGVESCVIRNLVHFKERNQTVYLFLFLNDLERNIHSQSFLFGSILKILSKHVRDFFFTIQNQKTVVQNEKIPVKGNSVIEKLEENFNSLLNLSNDLIFFLDQNGCFLTISNSCSLILDYTIEELKGKHFLDIIPADNKTEIAGEINKLLGGKKTVKFNSALESKLGRCISFNFTCQPVIQNNNVTGLIVIGADVSKLNQFEEELLRLKPKLIEAQRLISIERARVWQQSSIIEELDRIKGEFVSNISHEFRTPLASIIGFSETIVSDPDLPEEMKSEFNHVILNEGKRLAKLINDVLDLSNVEGGKIALNKSGIDIIELVKSVVEKKKEDAQKKKLLIDYEYPEESVMIEADSEKLAQSFEALIDNAIKFTNEDGRVKIVVNNLFKEIEIIISDTGVGIPEKDLPYIFQKFYRVSRPGTEIPGTGIGLVFVKQMVDMHKGLISVRSELGNGTTFIIKFLKSFKVKS